MDDGQADKRGGQVCTWCLIELTYPSALLRVTPRDVEPDTFHEICSAAERGDLTKKREAILRAWAEGWPVQINAYTVHPPITTWQGDPVCEVHLHGIAQRELEPQTVRLAQRGPRRPGHG